jgi:hypothetical protein
VSYQIKIIKRINRTKILQGKGGVGTSLNVCRIAFSSSVSVSEKAKESKMFIFEFHQLTASKK